MDDFDYRPNYNVAPTHNMPVVVSEDSSSRRIEQQRWGLLPFWAKDKNMSYKMINARSETVDSKKSYKPYFKKQRCLIPASGSYEWTGKKSNKTPYYIQPTEQSMFAFAGIYSKWEPKKEERGPIKTYSILTTEANQKMSDLHHMPVMLIQEEWQEWLDSSNHNTKALKELLKPFPDDGIDYCEVDKVVNNVENNFPDLTKKVNLF